MKVRLPNFLGEKKKMGTNSTTPCKQIEGGEGARKSFKVPSTPGKKVGLPDLPHLGVEKKR